MSAGKFWILIALSSIIVVLIGLEVVTDNQVLRLSDALANNQANMARAEHDQEKLREMVQRLVVAAQTDPDLADLLGKNGVHISSSTHARDAAGTPPSNAKASSPAPEVPPAVQ